MSSTSFYTLSGGAVDVSVLETILKNGSAYDIWLAQGNTGTEQDFLDSLVGATGAAGAPGQDGLQGQAGVDGDSAYQIWLDAGNVGTTADFLNSLIGDPGPAGSDGIDAYQTWLNLGNVGTEQDFINSFDSYQSLNFPTRSAFVAAAPSLFPSDGTVVNAGGLQYVRSSGTSVLSDLPDWLPFGDVYFDHFVENTVPGTTLMSAAMQPAVDYAITAQKKLKLKATTYLIDETGLIHIWDRVTIEGEGWSYEDDYDAGGPTLQGSVIKLATGSLNTYSQGIITIAPETTLGFARVGAVLKDFLISGNRHTPFNFNSTANNAYGFGIYVTGASRVLIDNVCVFRCAETGVAALTNIRTIDPATQVNTTTNTIAITGGHFFYDDMEVFYSDGGGTAIGGLTDATEYFIVNRTPTTFQLSATKGGSPINLTSVGAGSAHTFEANGDSRGGVNNLWMRNVHSLQNADKGFHLAAGDSYGTGLEAGANGGQGINVGSMQLSNIKVWDNIEEGVFIVGEVEIDGGTVYDSRKSGIRTSTSAFNWSVRNVTLQDNGREATTDAEGAAIWVNTTGPGIITGIRAFQKNNDGSAGNLRQKFGIYSSVACDVTLGACDIGDHSTDGGDRMKFTNGSAILRLHANEVDFPATARHPGFVVTGNIDMDRFDISGIGGIGYDVWGTGTFNAGTLSLGGGSLVSVSIPGGGTVTDITSDIAGLPRVIIRNISNDPVVFDHNASKLRLIGGTDKTLNLHDSIEFIYVSGAVWQQVGGKQ